MRHAMFLALALATTGAGADDPPAKRPPAPAKPPAAPPTGAGLGVTVGPLPEALRAHLGLGKDKGVMVVAVRRDGPADQAGVKKFDVLVEIDGQPINAAGDWKKLLAARKPGAAAKLRLVTSARFAEVPLTLGAADLTDMVVADDDADAPPRGPGLPRRRLPGFGAEDLPDMQVAK